MTAATMIYGRCHCGAVTFSTTGIVKRADLYCWSDRCQEQQEVDGWTLADLEERFDRGTPA